MRNIQGLTRVAPLPAEDAASDAPALIPLSLLIVGFAGLLQWLMPVAIIGDIVELEDIDSRWLAAAGALLAATGLFVSAAAYMALVRNSGADPWKPAATLVTGGIYGWTRNPGYLGVMVGLCGVGLAMEFDWLVMLIGPVWMLLNFAAVRPEELYLRSEFGEQYERYVRRVPRYFFIR